MYEPHSSNAHETARIELIRERLLSVARAAAQLEVIPRPADGKRPIFDHQLDALFYAPYEQRLLSLFAYDVFATCRKAGYTVLAAPLLRSYQRIDSTPRRLNDELASVVWIPLFTVCTY